MKMMLKFLAGIVLTCSYVILTSGKSIGESPALLRPKAIELNIHLERLPQTSGGNFTKRVRQDEGDAGELGENVNQILTGVLGGGLGNVFLGSSNFIGDSSVQQEVQSILTNIAPSLDVVLKYGFDGIKRYFGITSPRPQNETVTEVPVGGSQQAPGASQQGGTVAPAAGSQGPVVPIANQGPVAPIANQGPAVAPVATQVPVVKDEDDDENESALIFDI